MKRVLMVVVVLMSMSLTNLVFVAAANGDKLAEYGMRGLEVKNIQLLLAQQGFYPAEFDGVFGNITLKAVKDFQLSVGLEATGIVDKKTYEYLQRSGKEPNRYNRSLNVVATAYTAYDDGNTSYTYRGNIVRKGLVAVDPKVIPLGTRMYIPGYGYAIADDIGSAIKGNKIDLAFENRHEALQFGRQTITVLCQWLG